MKSNIELVDRADQAKGRYRFEQIGGHRREAKGDLFLKVEEDDDASVASMASTADDYLGLEIATELQQRVNRKRRRALCLIIMTVMLLVGSVAYVTRSNNNNKTQPSNASSSSSSPENNEKPTVSDNTPKDNTEVDQTEEPTRTYTLWPTVTPLPAFTLCPPPRVPSNERDKGLDVFHMHNLRIVPESPTKDDYEDEWEYTFSSMDISEDASLIAVGLSDFSADTTYSVGLVRAFGFDCEIQDWKQLGQDLLGLNDGEEFGHRISSSRDGKVMAVSAPQNSYEGGNGFVQVYYLEDNHWDQLGSRIDNLDSTGQYSYLGHAVDLSDKGETLAVLALVDTNSFVVRVFEYDYNKKDWVRKGHDIKVQVSYADGYDYDPQLSLSEDGDELAMADPQIGVIYYHFDFESNKWKQQDTKSAGLEQEDDFWVDSVDFDDDGNLFAFSAFQAGATQSNEVKVVDFSSGNGTEVYVRDFPDFQVGIAVAVSDDGQVAAVVASREDIDDDVVWLGDVEYVGAMTVITKDESGGEKWRVIGQGTKAENIGVPGNFVSLSGDGKVAAVGSDSVVGFYGIMLKPSSNGNGTSEEVVPEKESNTTDTTPSFSICTPFPNATSGHVYDLDKLPHQPKEHTLSLAMSANGSVLAIGIDAFEGENRGMARVFAWDCSAQDYVQLGQDLFGGDEFDGFGQSVDLSSDGMILVVGANQPPPGKSGYVEVYSFTDGEWKIVDRRLDNMRALVEDVGREVRVSDDGTIVMFSGSIVEELDDGWHETASFIRVVENVGGKWKSKGDDLLSSIGYDEFGAEVHISQSGDGQTLGVTGSYSAFMAKVYTFNDKKNWTETVIPPIKSSGSGDNEDEWDLYYDSFFSGSDIALNDDGNFVAIAGSKYENDEEFAVVRVLQKDATTGNWTLSHDPVDYEYEYIPSAVAISGDGQKLAVGINSHTDDSEDQGALYVAAADDSDLGWSKAGNVDGPHKNDLLGSRVSISRDGTLAAASSRHGYVAFFKIS